MSVIPPQPFRWDGDAMIPLRPKVADQHFVIGEVYTLETMLDRSAATHRHYFAAVHEAWVSLPEEKAEEFPTSEHLRKKALIKAGYRDERSIVCSSRAEALRLSAFLKPIDDFSIIVVSGATVIRLSAKSQSMRAMGKKVFAESKEAVLGVLAEMIGVSAPELERAGASA